jgi:hypothetical protein
MSDAILTAASNAVALDDPIRETAIGSPSPIRCMPSLAPHTSNGKLAVGLPNTPTSEVGPIATRGWIMPPGYASRSTSDPSRRFSAATQTELLWLAICGLLNDAHDGARQHRRSVGPVRWSRPSTRGCRGLARAWLLIGSAICAPRSATHSLLSGFPDR